MASVANFQSGIWRSDNYAKKEKDQEKFLRYFCHLNFEIPHSKWHPKPFLIGWVIDIVLKLA